MNLRGRFTDILYARRRQNIIFQQLWYGHHVMSSSPGKAQKLFISARRKRRTCYGPAGQRSRAHHRAEHLYPDASGVEPVVTSITGHEGAESRCGGRQPAQAMKLVLVLIGAFAFIRHVSIVRCAITTPALFLTPVPCRIRDSHVMRTPSGPDTRDNRNEAPLMSNMRSATRPISHSPNQLIVNHAISHSSNQPIVQPAIRPTSQSCNKAISQLSN